MIRIHFVGGEKGGVGKSVLSRILAQYHIDGNKPFSAFDGDLSHGALIRYYGDYAKAVDISNFESVDQIAEVAAEQGCDVIVDLAAQSATNIDQWMAESGLLELAEEMSLQVILWHVMDDGSDSVRLLEKTLDTYGADLKYVLVRNHGRGSDFSLLDQSEAKAKAESFGAQTIDLPKLHAGSMLKIDRVGASLWSAANNKDQSLGPTLGLLERQRVKVWLNKAYAELDRVLDQAEIDTEIDAESPAASSPEVEFELEIIAEPASNIEPEVSNAPQKIAEPQEDLQPEVRAESDINAKPEIISTPAKGLHRQDVLGYTAGFFRVKSRS